MTDPLVPRSLETAQWDRVAELFELAVALPPAERDARLLALSGPDHAVLETVRRMLAADDADQGLLRDGVAAVAHLALEPEPHLAPGDRVGDFDIVGALDRGGMGVIFTARDRTLGRSVALKFLPSSAAQDDEATERLIAEARAASALDHPNVAAIYQIGATEDGRRFIAMPRYEGESLRARLARGPVAVAEALAIARQVASGLAAAHGAGIVHRDVTPANIFLTRQGPVKLLDFGIAALAGTRSTGGATRGTVAYMSPEQARREPANARTDVWSLGVVLFRMLTGEVPFPGDSTAEILTRLCGREPPPRLAGRPGIPAPLARVVDRALAKDAATRFADAGDMLAALERATPAPGHRRRMLGGLALAAAATLAFTANAVLRSDRSTATPMLLVQPLRQVGADSATTELAGGVLDEVTNRLAGLGRVRVAAPGDPLQGSDPADRYQVETAIRAGGGGHWLDVTLRRSRSNRVLWSESRPFHPGGLRELSGDLADGLLRAVGVVVTPAQRSVLSAGFPSSTEAYQAFLQGNQLLRLRTPAAVAGAAERYREALRFDSSYVAALARSAYTHSLLIDWGWRHPERSHAELLREGIALADRALALDSASAEAWLTRAYLMVQQDPRRMSGAVDAFQRAIALDPYNAEAFHQYGQTLMVLGRFGEAMAAYRRTIELEPDRAMTLVPMAAIHAQAGRPADALRLLDSAVSAAPAVAYARAVRSIIRTQVGNLDGARVDAEETIRLDPTYPVPGLSALARALWLLGDTAAALRRLADARAAMVDPLVPTSTEARFIASAMMVMERLDEAASLVHRVRPRGAWLWFYFQHDDFNELRRDPRVAAALAEADPRAPPDDQGPR